MASIRLRAGLHGRLDYSLLSRRATPHEAVLDRRAPYTPYCSVLTAARTCQLAATITCRCDRLAKAVQYPIERQITAHTRIALFLELFHQSVNCCLNPDQGKADAVRCAGSRASMSVTTTHPTRASGSMAMTIPRSACACWLHTSMSLMPSRSTLLSRRSRFSRFGTAMSYC